ncbi:hypothetical protein L218DRAFT_1003466 [Marasmius fiardii PR-910]|nr:hypothetical protein L218DRAFT_1003466 [Marasmius fiardii PR-910]
MAQQTPVADETTWSRLRVNADHREMMSVLQNVLRTHDGDPKQHSGKFFPESLLRIVWSMNAVYCRYQYISTLGRDPSLVEPSSTPQQSIKFEEPGTWLSLRICCGAETMVEMEKGRTRKVVDSEAVANYREWDVFTHLFYLHSDRGVRGPCAHTIDFNL